MDPESSTVLRHLSYLQKPKKKSREQRNLTGQDWERRGEYTYLRRETIPEFLENPTGLSGLFGSSISAREMLFFDTETTGLSTGAGSIVFLVGLGQLVKDGFEIEQVFLSDFPGEDEFLSILAERLLPDRLYVSYNGKAFDRHMLSSRFTLNGRQLELPRQLDLLYISRRLWKSLIGACGLSNIEREVLNIIRQEDVPSWEIPDIYFDFLRTGDDRPLNPVFTHNHQDILTLFRLVDCIEGILSGNELKLPFDGARLGEFLLDRGDTAGIAFLRDACEEGSLRAGMRLSLYYKRRGQWNRAIELWENMERRGSSSALVELAKYYEHRANEPETALSCIERIERSKASGRELRRELTIRRQRLKRKISRKRIYR